MPLAVSLAGVSVIYCLMVLFAMEEKEAGRGPAQARLDGPSLRAGDPRVPDAAPLLLVWRRRLLEVRHDLPRASAAGLLDRSTSSRRAGVARRCTRPQEFSRYYNLVSILRQHGDRLPVDRVLPARSPARASAYPSASRPAHRARAAGLLLADAAGPVPTAAIGQARRPGGGEPRARPRRLPRRRPALLLDQAHRARRRPSKAIWSTLLPGSSRPTAGTLPDGEDRGDPDDRFARLSQARPTGGGAAADRRREGRAPLRSGDSALRHRDRGPAGRSRTDGVFSPIVYVTGVSYLERSVAGTDTTVLGFVGGHTTRKIALEACERDAFRERARSGNQSDAPSIPACATDS